MILTMAILKPVLQEVVSIMVSPGERMPCLSASSIMYNAILSLEEWPGLKASTLAKYSPLNSDAILLSLISGVFPIRSNKNGARIFWPRR